MNNDSKSGCFFSSKNNKTCKSKSQGKITGNSVKEYERKNYFAKEFVPIPNETVETQINKVAFNCLAEKLRNLHIPRTENKSKSKLENKLSKLSTNVSSDEKKSKRTIQSAKHNVKKLKWKFDTNKLESPKYYSRYKISKLKEILKTWIENITKDDFTEKIKEIFNYVYEKLEPTVLCRPRSVSQYTTALKSNITNIINDLPILFNVSNKNINSIFIVNKIISIDDDIPVTYIQPTTNEIKQLVKDEVAYFIPNSDTAINNKRMMLLQAKLTEYLLDITDNEEEDKYITKEIAHLLKDVTRISESKAQYLANIMINDYKAFFFRRNQFSKKEGTNNMLHNYFPLFKENSVTTDDNLHNFKTYKKMLVNEIDSWLTGINISTLSKQSKQLAIESLASDIIDRYKFLKMEGDAVNSFDFSKHLRKDYDDKAIENAQKEFKDIKKTSLPVFVATHESCVENLKEQIYNWFSCLPSDIYDLEPNVIKQFVNNLAEDIKNTVISKNLRIIDNIIDEWVTKTFSGMLNKKYTQSLHIIIKSTSLYQLAFAQIYPENEERILHDYEQIIDEWLDSLLLCFKENTNFTNLKKHCTHELAKILYFNMDRLSQSPADEIVKRMQEVVSKWLKKIPLKTKIKTIDEQKNYTLQLLTKVQEIKHEDLMDLADRKIDEESRTDSVEAWINKLPLKVTDFDSFHSQKEKFIANIKYLKNSGSDDDTVVKEIIKFMKTLPMEVNNKINDRCLDDKANNVSRTSEANVDRKRLANEHDIIEAVGDVIEDWVRNLPVEPIYNPKYLCQLIKEITSILTTIIRHSQLKLTDENDDLKLEDKIISFLLKLPLGLGQISEMQLAEISNNLVEALKEIYFNEVDKSFKYIRSNNSFRERNVSIYDVFTKRKSQYNSAKSKKSNRQSINEIDNNEENLNVTENGTIKENLSYKVAETNTGEFSQMSAIERSDFARPADTVSSGTQLRSPNTKKRIFDRYNNILKQKIAELPIDTPTPESERLADLARTGIFNGIIKTFFRLKSDPEIQNDYAYFELILENKLDDMLDLLPQTDEMKTFRNCWKPGILANVLDMLKELQEATDRPSFKQRLKNGFNRQFARRFELEKCFMLQQGFLAEMADAYILHTKYKEDDHVRANIYKQRLMKKVDELANHLMREHDTEFRFLKKSKLIEYAMKAMESVPIPKDDILDEEIEELELVEEIEKWYNKLPISPYLNDFDVVFRKRMIALLAKKLLEIEKNNDEFSKGGQMRHEMSKFLTERGRLQPDQDLNINMMVDELTDKLQNRHLNITTDYDVFEQHNPITSTFANDYDEINTPQNISQRRDEKRYTHLGNEDNSAANQNAPHLSTRSETARHHNTTGNQITTKNTSPRQHYSNRFHPDSNSYTGQIIEEKIPFSSLRHDHSNASFKQKYETNQRHPQASINKSIWNRNTVERLNTDRSNYTRSNNNYQNNAYHEFGEMLQENDRNSQVPVRPNVRFSPNTEERICPQYSDRITTRIGSTNGGSGCLDEDIDRIGTKCRCTERFRKRRRICVDSYPCPSFGLPCLCRY